MATFTQAREAQTHKHPKKPLVRSWESGEDEVAGGKTNKTGAPPHALIMEGVCTSSTHPKAALLSELVFLACTCSNLSEGHTMCLWNSTFLAKTKKMKCSQETETIKTSSVKKQQKKALFKIRLWLVYLSIGSSKIRKVRLRSSF